MQSSVEVRVVDTYKGLRLFSRETLKRTQSNLDTREVRPDPPRHREDNLRTELRQLQFK